MDGSMYLRALHWLGMGFELVPIQPGVKHLVAGFGAYLGHIQTPDQARFWFDDRSANLGLVIADGLVVLDFDQVSDYWQWRAAAGALAGTYTERTRRGYHVFVRGVPGSLAGIAVEVKRSGVIALAPSAISGYVYQVEIAGAILSTPELPTPTFSLLSASSPGKPLSGGKVELVDKLKAAWPILALAEQLTELRARNGRWYSGRCPFHADHDPSFWVDTELGIFGCSACKVRGDVINLYALAKGLPMQQAIREMARGLDDHLAADLVQAKG